MTQKVVVEAREDAASFVASAGEIRGAHLEAAIGSCAARSPRRAAPAISTGRSHPRAVTRLGAWLLASGLSLASIAAHAELRLVLDARTLDAEQRAASQALLDEAMAALPRAWCRASIARCACNGATTCRNRLMAAPAQAPELNRRLLPALTDGSAAEEKTVAARLCAVAAINTCCRAITVSAPAISGQIGLPDDCRGQTDRRFTLSDDPRLLDLAGWPQRVGKRGLREQDNAQLARSPDPYELTSPLEFVAVNLEYFLLDPSYACRRPSLHRYFSEHFGWAPEPADCTPGYPSSTPVASSAARPVEP